MTKRDDHQFTVGDRIYCAYNEFEMAKLHIDRLTYTWGQIHGCSLPSSLMNIMKASDNLHLLLEEARRQFPVDYERLKHDLY